MADATFTPGGQSSVGRSLAALHRFARQRPVALECCDLCAEPIPPEHRHLVELPERNLRCVCRACALLFDRDAASLGKYRLVGDRRLRLLDFHLDDPQWQRLGIPVGMAFFRCGTDGEITACYPGAAGATQAAVDPSAWDELPRCNPVLRSLQPEVEALLVDRIRGARRYFLVPIDDCFRLVALVRGHWRGLTGGSAVWSEVEHFFDRLDRCSRAVSVSD